MTSQRPQERPSPWHRRHWRALLYSSAITTALAVLVFALLYGYLSSQWFTVRLQRAVVEKLAQATGGRVELQAFHWNVFHMRIRADGLTIHGLEAADQVPYLHVDHIEMDAKLLAFFLPRLGLARLSVEHPVFHLIIYPDGSTNQPHPKVQRQHAPLVQSLFDLAVDHTRVQDGVFLVQDHAVPWQFAADKLDLSARYMTANGHYQASLSVRDLTFRLQNDQRSRSTLRADLDLAPNAASISHMELDTADARLDISGSLRNYAHPTWQATTQGTVDLHGAAAIIGYGPLRAGTAEVHLTATGTDDGAFSVDGTVAARQGAFQAPWLALQHVDLRTHLHIDNRTILFTQFASVLDGQGHVDGMLQLLNWMGPPVADHQNKSRSATTAALRQEGGPQPLQALLEATVKDLPSPLVLSAVAPARFGEIGFSAEVTGPVRATWHGPGDALDVHGELAFRPERRARPGAVPVSGTVDADYLGDTERLDFQKADLTTPGTSVHASGTLTLMDHDTHSTLQGMVTSRDLGEFDRLLYILLDTSPSMTAAEARQAPSAPGPMIPVHLMGSATVRGQLTGSLFIPDFRGHVDAQQFVTQLDGLHPSAAGRQHGPAIHTLQWDSLHADVDLGLDHVMVRHAVVARGETILHADALVRLTPTGNGAYALNSRSTFQAGLRVVHASVPDLQAILGTNFPVNGSLSANAQVHGVLTDLHGSGTLTMTDGAVYGQPVPYLASAVRFADHRIYADPLRARIAGGTAQGALSYDYLDHAIQGSLGAKHLDLKQVRALQGQRAQVGGTGTVQLLAAGTTMAPSAAGSFVLDDVTVNDRPVGRVLAEVHLQGETLSMTAKAQLLQTHLEADGVVHLTGDLPAHLQMQFSDFDVGPVIQVFVHEGITGKSSIRGAMQLQGPLRRPRLLQMDADLQRSTVDLNGFSLASEGPVRFSMRNGVLDLPPVHIKGADTDLVLQGTADLLDGQRLNGHAEGRINAAVISSFSSNVTASGDMEFSLDARGTLASPRLVGKMQVRHVDMHMQEVTNGISALDGTLVFDQDRIVIRQLQGYTGGGKVDFTGFATYRNGLYLNLDAKAQDIRIRYPQGVTSMANADLHLGGSPDSLLLQGNVQLTRFSISENADMAALVSAGQSAAAPPDPTSPLNRVRLDIHLTSLPQLGFQNSIATLAGNVDLHLRGTLASPSVLGRIDITQGRVTFAGSQYTLQRGEILFANPVVIEPELNIQATARVRSYDIMVGLTGTMNKLQVTYRSEPPLSQDDVLALLALGRTNEEAAMYGEQQQVGSNPTTEALLGGALNAAVSSRMQKLFGVASVRVDPNFVGVLGQSTARVTVEQQVGRNVTLVFATNVNTTAQQLLQAQYDITRYLSIIAVRDEADVFSLYFQIRGKHR